MKKLLPFVFAGTLLLTACGNDDEATAQEVKEPVAVVDESAEQATDAAEVTEDAADEVIDDIYFSEKMDIAEAMESYRTYYTELDLDSMKVYFSEDSPVFEAQKQEVQSLIDQGVKIDYGFSFFKSVEKVGNNEYEVKADEHYHIYRDNEKEWVVQTVVYRLYYGYTDEILISSIEIQELKTEKAL